MVTTLHLRPSELQEQAALVRILRKSKLLFAAVPNGGYRLSREARNMRMSGVQAGVPDILVFDRPAGASGGLPAGLAIEMKRVGGTPCNVTPEQRRWLAELRQRGWLTIVAFGVNHAVEQMKGLGYELKGA